VTRTVIEPRILGLIEPLDSLAQRGTVVESRSILHFMEEISRGCFVSAKRTSLVVTGAETDVCVLATVLGAVDHGFPVLLARTRCAARRTRGHEALLGLFHGRFSEQVDVARTDDVLAAWSLGH
jgi:nicotinamidase-related amidase